jgi:excisionase family DNA binding protein
MRGSLTKAENATSIEPLLFTIREFAVIAKISVSKARQMVGNGDLEVVRIGRSVRVPKWIVLKLCGVK